MSIYATILSIDDGDHAEGCKRLVRKRGWSEIDNRRPCTCQAGPIAYQGSHVFPPSTVTRQGWFGLAAIPGHINSRELKPLSEDMHPYWPWLRVSLGTVPGQAEGQGNVILDRQQVALLIERLQEWMKLSDAGI